MNNKTISIITTIVFIILISSGMLTKASALTNVEKYNNGWSDLTTGDDHELISDDLSADLTNLGSHEFQTHTDAYKNGYIAALDHYHKLTLPYTDFNPHSYTVASGDNVSTPTFTYYYQNTAETK